jgi:threonine/homoserine/homoserine lactone efflux protein
MQAVIGGIYLLGGAFLAYLAYESLCFKGADLEIGKVNPQSFKKGIIANFLNPSPYLFWISIGAPTVLKASENSITAASVFILSFYVLLVGSKVGVAIIMGKSRALLKSTHYIYTMRGLGIALLGFAILFFRDGLRQFGFI